jgi:hypothetical protein
MGVIQHQAPDTTSPSPPHPFTINGTAIPNTNGFPSAMLPQGKLIHRIFLIIILIFVKMDLFLYGHKLHQLQLIYVINQLFFFLFQEISNN